MSVSIVFGEVGKADPVFHLTSECASIPSEGAVALRWAEATERIMLPRFCEACGPLAGAR